MKKIIVLTTILAALSLNLSASDIITDTFKTSSTKKHKLIEDIITVDKAAKSKK